MSSQSTAHPNRRTPTAYQLRSLVLDYLCHNCYTDTARAFLRDSTVKQLDADGDEILASSDGLDTKSESSSGLPETLLRQVEHRREIRELILAGRVDNATELLNRYFPSVLSGSVQDILTADKAEEPLSSSFTSRSVYVSSTSVEPSHLLLNLRILAFSESCRTIPLEYPPRLPTDQDMETLEQEPSASVKLEDPVSAEQQMILLSKAQKLYSLVHALPNPIERDIYMKELENVAGLLAYKVPEESSMAKYLTFERREALADQINCAILRKAGLASISSVELLTRYTCTLWRFAKQHGVKPRPGAVVPPTISQPAIIPSKVDSDPEEVACFDLRQFLDTKP